MEIDKVYNAQNQEEGRQIAIDWQTWQSDRNMSMQELIEWQDAFIFLAARFDLQEEFTENGII
jgi:hypothetical protein